MDTKILILAVGLISFICGLTVGVVNTSIVSAKVCADYIEKSK